MGQSELAIKRCSLSLEMRTPIKPEKRKNKNNVSPLEADAIISETSTTESDIQQTPRTPTKSKVEIFFQSIKTKQ